MKEVVDSFQNVIYSSRFDIEQAAGQKLVERCELILIDGTRLVAYESTTGSKFKYGYQWMNENDQTIFRWDNTAHFPQFATYPFHRHVGAAEQAEPFPMITLTQVLQFIADHLANQN